MKPLIGTGDAAIDAVLNTSHRLRERANAELATCGLSLWTFKALRVLDDLGPSRSVDLSERLGMAPRTVTGAVDALESEGLVERRAHPTDRRAHLLVLTDEGRTRLAEALAVHSALIAQIGASIPAASRDEFLAMMQSMSDAVTVVPAPAR